MANRWFVTLDGREQGPLNAKTLKIMVAKELIQSDTPVRRDDLTHPVPAARIKGLLPGGSGDATPATGLSQTRAQHTSAQGSEPTSRAVRSVPSTPAPAHASGPRRDLRPSKRLTERTGPSSAAQSPRPPPVRISEVTPAPIAAGNDGRGAGDDNRETGDETFSSASAIAARASFGQRALALVIDLALLMVLGAIVLIAGMMLVFAGLTTEQKATKDAWDRNQPQEEHLKVPYQQWEQRRPLFEAYARGGEPLPGAPAIVAASATMAELDLTNDRKYVADWTNTFNRTELKSAPEHGRLAAGNLYVFGMLIVIAGSVIIMAIIPLSEAIWSTTLGKKLLRLRILDREGRRIGPARALLRHVLRCIPFGQLRALSQDRLALHDLLTGTEITHRAVQRKRVTVRSAREVTPPLTAPLGPPTARRRA